MCIKMFNSTTYFLLTILTSFPKSRADLDIITLPDELVGDESLPYESLSDESLAGESLSYESYVDEPFQNITDSKLNKLEGFIVGGSYARIEDFPHSAFLVISCHKQEYEDFTCGSSILNQWMLLTAAHCFDGCRRGTKILVSVGSRTKTKGSFHTVAKFANHGEYDGFDMKNDIAMAILVKPLVFSNKVKRVLLSQVGIYDEPALLAGWGVTDVIFFYYFETTLEC